MHSLKHVRQRQFLSWSQLQPPSYTVQLHLPKRIFFEHFKLTEPLLISKQKIKCTLIKFDVIISITL
jgi:hypothetical protein